MASPVLTHPASGKPRGRKARQMLPHSCGPACWRAMLDATGLRDFVRTEAEWIRRLRCSTEFGTRPGSWVRGAWHAGVPAAWAEGWTPESVPLPAALLITTDPDYGHWVLALRRTTDHALLIDDPWDDDCLYVVPPDALLRCWHWRFLPHEAPHRRGALWIPGHRPVRPMPTRPWRDWTDPTGVPRWRTLRPVHAAAWRSADAAGA